MSRKSRETNDFYPTPRWVVRRYLEAVPPLRGEWWESAIGDGDIVFACEDFLGRDHAQWYGTDIVLREKVKARLGDNAREQSAMHTLPDSWPGVFDGMMTNPPFKAAEDFLRVGLNMAHEVVLLLPLKWLESAKRSSLLDHNMPDVFVLPDRPSFRADGQTDVTAYAWMRWMSGSPRRFGNVSRLASTPVHERRP